MYTHHNRHTGHNHRHTTRHYRCHSDGPLTDCTHTQKATDTHTYGTHNHTRPYTINATYTQPWTDQLMTTNKPQMHTTAERHMNTNSYRYTNTTHYHRRMNRRCHWQAHWQSLWQIQKCTLPLTAGGWVIMGCTTGGTTAALAAAAEAAVAAAAAAAELLHTHNHGEHCMKYFNEKIKKTVTPSHHFYPNAN